MMQKTNPECINVTESILLAPVCWTAASRIDSVTSMGSANCGCKEEGRNRKPNISTQYSMLGDGELDNFTCDSCQETFLSKYALLKHVFIHIDSVKPPLYICRQCGEVFPTQRSLQIHSKMKENQCIVAKKGSSNKRENYRKLRSLQCSRNTSEHRQENVSLGSDDGSFRQTGKDIPQPEHSDGDSYQTCVSKDVTLSKLKHSETGQRPRAAHRSNTSLMPSAHLKRHELVHSVDMLNMCSDCGRCFKYQVHLMQHAVSHRKKSFACDDCGRTFKRPVDLRQHTWSHTGEKPHKCKCGKAFAKSGSLKRHEMVHRGERPFRCDMCFKTFTDAHVLKNHALVHTGERAHVCDKCGKAFKEVGHLRRHTLLHTGEKPYVCRICRRSFTQSGSLKRHTRVHTGEKPYKCGVCSKSFADCSNWRAHSLKYHREETHKCDICEKRFVKRHSLLQHVRVHIL